MSFKYEMTTIVSIHQPNNDLFHMFYNIYVLSKGGVCVYSGPPRDLAKHLIRCDIECNENQVPIEVILKVCSKGDNNLVKQMVNKCKRDLLDTNTDKMIEIINESNSFSKRFVAIDFFNLLLRTMTIKYLRQWKEISIQILIYLSIAYTMKLIVSPDMVIPNGCLEIDFGMGCNETLEDIKNEFFLKQNIRYNLYFTISLSLVIVIIHSLTFCTDFKILSNECKNGMS